METETLNALVTGSAGLLGAIVGGLTSYGTSVGQHKRQVEKEKQDAIREREHEAARECEALCVAIADEMERAPHPMDRRTELNPPDRQAVRAARKKLEAAGLYLPEDLRSRVQLLGTIAANAGDLSYPTPLGTVCHYHSPYQICMNVRTEIRAIVAAFVQSKKLPKRTHIIDEYSAAMDDLNNDRAEYYSYSEDTPEGKEDGRNKEDFYKRHPKLRPKD